MRRLPPLSALRMFEAAARHGSFKRAADELAVTPTAVSHQIRSLEEHLGLSLFERGSRRVRLTPAGDTLFPVLRDGFDGFAEAVERITRRRSRPQVTIAATIGFTARWLVPRLARFQGAYPDIDLQLQASDEVIDLDAGVADLAIRYGQGPYPGDARVLLEDAFAPVANPLLGIRDVEALTKAPLIEFAWRRAHPLNPTWERWFEVAGMAMPTAPSRLRFSDESHAIQSAVAGQGIALGSLTLVSAELAAGQLVQPFAETLPSHTHHLLVRDGAPDMVRRVADWLIGEAQGAPVPRAPAPPSRSRP